MAERHPGRHRALQHPSTPLNPLAAALGERVVQARRRSLVVVSSGLLATGGIGLPGVALPAPASAADRQGAQPEAESWSADPSSGSWSESGSALTAPAEAAVDFDRSWFTAVPPPPRPVNPLPQAAPAVPKAAVRTLAASRTVARLASGGGRHLPASAAPGASPRPAVHSTAAIAGRSTAPAVAAGGRGAAVIAIAARYVGVPYVYGGTTPRGFDCSGYVQYVFAQLGIRLPRTADQQMRATRQIPRSQAQPGDLVAFVSGGAAYHIAIYAGGGMIYDAPHTGSSVGRRAIWTSAVVFTRVP